MLDGQVDFQESADMYITGSNVIRAFECNWKNCTIITPNECVTVIPAQLTVHVFCCLFKSNVHVSIDRL